MPKKEALILFLKTSLLSCRADKEEWIGEAWKLSPAKHQKNVRVDKQVSWDTMSKVQHIAPCVWIDEILQLILSIYFVSAQTSLKLMSNRLNFILLFQLHKVQWTISFFFFFLQQKCQLFLNIDWVCKKNLQDLNWRLCSVIGKNFYQYQGHDSRVVFRFIFVISISLDKCF